MRVVRTLPDLNALDETRNDSAQDSPRAAYRPANDVTDRTEQPPSSTPTTDRIGRVPGTRELVLPRTPYMVGHRALHRFEVLAVIDAAREWPDDFK